jgi:ATP-dependent RNA helicase RhlE
VHVDQHNKRELLTQLIGLNNMHQVLVFTKTKFGADKLARALTDDGLPSVAMHGNKSQAQRTKALQKFKRGAARILVATDVAARGIDIQKLPYVINFELPMVAEDYVHRIGRTGRAGEKGEAISFVCATEHRLMRDIQHLLKVEVEFEVADGFEPEIPFPVKKPKGRPQPRKHGKSSGARRSGQRNDSRSDRSASASQSRRRDNDRSERREWNQDHSSAGGRTDSRQSRPQRDGERSERREWTAERPSRGSKPGQPRHGKQGASSTKSSRPSSAKQSQQKRDGFAPPKRKVTKRAIAAR